jgi:hypothetical protein
VFVNNYPVHSAIPNLRPVYHHKEDRVTGHLYLLAYHLVHTLRYRFGFAHDKQLKQQGVHSCPERCRRVSYNSICNLMSTQQRITITLPTEDNKTIHLWTTTKPEIRQKQIYAALSIKPDLVGKCKTIIGKKKSVVSSEIK